MRIVWAVACRYAEMSDGGGATIIGAGVDRADVPAVPYELGLGIVLKVAARPDESGTTQKIGFCFRDPMLHEQGRMESSIDVPALPDGHPDGLDNATVIPTWHVFQIEMPGVHQISIDVNGDHFVSVPFAVQVGEGVPPA